MRAHIKHGVFVSLPRFYYCLYKVPATSSHNLYKTDIQFPPPSYEYKPGEHGYHHYDTRYVINGIALKAGHLGDVFDSERAYMDPTNLLEGDGWDPIAGDETL